MFGLGVKTKSFGAVFLQNQNSTEIVKMCKSQPKLAGEEGENRRHQLGVTPVGSSASSVATEVALRAMMQG